jgi:hypothetical protein
MGLRHLYHAYHRRTFLVRSSHYDTSHRTQKKKQTFGVNEHHRHHHHLSGLCVLFTKRPVLRDRWYTKRYPVAIYMLMVVNPRPCFLLFSLFLFFSHQRRQ